MTVVPLITIFIKIIHMYLSTLVLRCPLVNAFNSYTVGFKDRDILELGPLPVTRGSISLLIILVSLTWNRCHFNPETSPGDLAGRALDLGRTNNASAPDPEA